MKLKKKFPNKFFCNFITKLISNFQNIKKLQVFIHHKTFHKAPKCRDERAFFDRQFYQTKSLSHKNRLDLMESWLVETVARNSSSLSNLSSCGFLFWTGTFVECWTLNFETFKNIFQLEIVIWWIWKVFHENFHKNWVQNSIVDTARIDSCFQQLNSIIQVFITFRQLHWNWMLIETVKFEFLNYSCNLYQFLQDDLEKLDRGIKNDVTVVQVLETILDMSISRGIRHIFEELNFCALKKLNFLINWLKYFHLRSLPRPSPWKTK